MTCDDRLLWVNKGAEFQAHKVLFLEEIRNENILFFSRPTLSSAYEERGIHHALYAHTKWPDEIPMKGRGLFIHVRRSVIIVSGWLKRFIMHWISVRRRMLVKQIAGCRENEEGLFCDPGCLSIFRRRFCNTAVFSLCVKLLIFSRKLLNLRASAEQRHLIWSRFLLRAKEFLHRPMHIERRNAFHFYSEKLSSDVGRSDG